jgi:hypothetical protein
MMTTNRWILVTASSFHFVVIDKSVHLRYSMQSETSFGPHLKGETIPCVKDSVNCAAGAKGN